MNKNNIDHMVDRFLTWEFPADFNPDGAIAFNRNPDYPMPVGTNLLTATQAKAMIEYIVEGMTYTQADVDAANNKLAKALEIAELFSGGVEYDYHGNIIGEEERKAMAELEELTGGKDE